MPRRLVRGRDVPAAATPNSIPHHRGYTPWPSSEKFAMAQSGIKRFLFSAASYGRWPDLGLLIGRVTFGALMAYGHGWGKLSTFSETDKFYDPFGLGEK